MLCSICYLLSKPKQEFPVLKTEIIVLITMLIAMSMDMKHFGGSWNAPLRFYLTTFCYDFFTYL